MSDLAPLRKAPPEQGAAAPLGAVLLGPRKAPLVSPAIHAAQHGRAGRARSGPAAGSTADRGIGTTASG